MRLVNFLNSKSKVIEWVFEVHLIFETMFQTGRMTDSRTQWIEIKPSQGFQVFIGSWHHFFSVSLFFRFVDSFASFEVITKLDCNQID